jgi:hypothetical protein
MGLGTWLRKVRDGLIQDDPNPESSNLDRLDGQHSAGTGTESRDVGPDGMVQETRSNSGRDQMLGPDDSTNR